MGKQIIPQRRAKSHGGLGGKILGSQGADKPNHPQQNQQPSHLQDINGIPVFNPYINNLCHHQRHKQLKAGL